MSLLATIAFIALTAKYRGHIHQVWGGGNFSTARPTPLPHARILNALSQSYRCFQFKAEVDVFNSISKVLVTAAVVEQ